MGAWGRGGVGVVWGSVFLIFIFDFFVFLIFCYDFVYLFFLEGVIFQKFKKFKKVRFPNLSRVTVFRI